MKELMEKKFWRFFSSFWGMLYFIVAIINFFGEGPYEYILGPLGTVYIASLGIFVGGKEFDRWHDKHPGKRRGEMFVVAFSLLMLIFFIFSFVTNGGYKITPDITATYIAVLSVFVIGQKSKELYGTRNKDQSHLL